MSVKTRTCRHGDSKRVYICNVTLCFASVPLGVQMAIVRSLLHLAPFHPHVTATACIQWVTRHREELSAGVRARVQDFILVYSAKLPYLADFKLT